MAITDLPLFGMLRTKMMWHQERQRVLAENVANADTPKFRPNDLAPPKLDPQGQATAGITLRRTAMGHVGSASGGNTFQGTREGQYDVRPSGNGVNVEDEMLKVAANQMDFQAVATLYARGLGLLKTAVGRR